MEQRERHTLIAFIGAGVLLPALRMLGWVEPLRGFAALGSYLAFGGMIFLGIYFVRNGVPLRTIARDALLTVGVATLFGLLLKFFGPQPAFYSVHAPPPVRPVDVILALCSNFFILALPATLAAALGAPSSSKEAPPSESRRNSIGTGLLFGLLPLMHIAIFFKGTPSYLEVPIYGILFITVPIGGLIALITVLLAAFRSRHAQAGAFALLSYILGTTLIFAGLSLLGARFTIPP